MEIQTTHAPTKCTTFWTKCFKSTRWVKKTIVAHSGCKSQQLVPQPLEKIKINSLTLHINWMPTVRTKTNKHNNRIIVKKIIEC